MGIKENIKIIRERYNLTQNDLAEIAGVTNKAVSAWESGLSEPRMGAIEKIAARFKLKKSNIIEDGGMEIENLNPSDHIALTPEEHSLLQKYRLLDDKGKHTVNTVLNMEYSRITE